MSKSLDKATTEDITGPSDAQVSRQSPEDFGESENKNLAEDSNTNIGNTLPDTEETGQPKGSTENQESTDTKSQDSLVSRTHIVKSPDRETSEETIGTTENEESTEAEQSQDWEVVSMAQSPVTKKSEATGTTENEEIPQDMVVVPGTQISKSSPDTETSEEATGAAENQGSTEAKTSQDCKVVPMAKSPDVSPGTGESGQSAGTTENETEPLCRTDVLALVQDSPQTSSKPWFYFRMLSYLWGTSNQEEKTDAAGNKSDGVSDESFKNFDPIDEAGMPAARQGKSFKEQMEKIRTIIADSAIYWYCFQGSHKVGIFSRSADGDYKWLVNQLKAEPFLRVVSNVQPHYIFNNRMYKFMEDIQQCTFGILYHTQNRGRVNITDITDSLYDEELKYMSTHLGKSNVIVIVDDLEDTSDEVKTQMLKIQPSIDAFAQDLLLFDKRMKEEIQEV